MFGPWSRLCPDVSSGWSSDDHMRHSSSEAKTRLLVSWQSGQLAHCKDVGCDSKLPGVGRGNPPIWKQMRILKEKEQRLVVGNLKFWAKIDLEGKQRHNFQEPGLLGTAGERASQEHLIRKPRMLLPPCVSSSAGWAWSCVCSYRDSVFCIPPPKRTSYLTVLHALLRITEQQVGIYDRLRKSRTHGCRGGGEVMLHPHSMWRDIPFISCLPYSFLLFTNCLKTWAGVSGTNFSIDIYTSYCSNTP